MIDQDIESDSAGRSGDDVRAAMLAPSHWYGSACARRLLPLQRRQARLNAKRGACGQAAHVRINLRPYQREVFEDRSSGILILHWSRQIGKSFTLAAWAVDRLLTRPGRLVTVLSNSRENGAEFVAKCAEVCRLNGTDYTSVDRSRGVRFQNMRMEVRIRAEGKTGRIKVLAANPRTARGFSGDLILDEFAFHEDSAAIWEAAEPILASNPDFLCRMASTGNGRHNLFYRMVEGIYDLRSRKRDRHTIDASMEKADGVGGDVEHPAKEPDSLLDARPHPGPLPQERESVRPVREYLDDGGASALAGSEGDGLKTDVFSHGAKEETDTETPSPRPLPQGGEGEETRGVPSREAGGLRAPMQRSRAGYAVSRITRTEAHGMGVKIYDANKRVAVSPDEAREQALDKRAYDQNYECVFADENATLLSHELINAAEREDVGIICENDWGNVVGYRVGSQWDARPHPYPLPQEREKRRLVQDNSDAYGRVVAVPNLGTATRGPSQCMELLRAAVGPLYVGFDVARKGDLSVITVMEDLNGMKVVRAILRMRDLRLPEQQQRLGEICRLPKFRRAAIDMTGLGLGLFEYAQEEFGASRIHGINFATSVPATRAVRVEGRKREMVRVTEAMAMELLQVYEDRRIQHPADNRLRDDLRKPEKITTPGGRVSIAATRDEAGHADHFWSFALALEAASHGGGTFHYQAVERRRRYLL